MSVCLRRLLLFKSHNYILESLSPNMTFLFNVKTSPISTLQRIIHQTNLINVKLYSKNVAQNISSEQNKSNTTQDVGLKKRTLEGGVIVADISVGNGAVAKSGKTIFVYYSGKLKSSNKVFDEMKEGPVLSFKLGRGDVISGWDIGVEGMKVGGKRTITCPPAMAYGSQGYPPVIPPNSTLVFEVELKNVK